MPVMQGTFRKYCRMHLRPWRDERHQTPKGDLLIFRFAASIQWYRARCRCQPKGRALLSSRIQAQSRLRDLVQNVMAVTDARSRFWLGNAVPAAITQMVFYG